MREGPLALAGILFSASAAFAAERMAPSDIQATFFNGRPFTASTTHRGTSLTSRDVRYLSAHEGRTDVRIAADFGDNPSRN
jgi:hypothetical protein